MGQYHLIVNLDQREFIDPHRLAVGLKAWEQLVNMPSTPQALFVLLLCSNGRGGGDLKPLADQAELVIGRWAGDRIAVVGDYAEDDDLPNGYPLPGDEPLSRVYDLCRDSRYEDITALIRPVLESELGVEYYEEHGFWCVRHDPASVFSVMDPEIGGAS